jgi:hypothetical protein
MRFCPMILLSWLKVKYCTSAPVRKMMPVQPNTMSAIVMPLSAGVLIGRTSP